MTGLVDAHHHLWDPVMVPYTLFDTYPRLAPLIPLGALTAYDAMARQQGIEAAVCVEVASAGATGEIETSWLVEQMLSSPLPRSLVAWAPVEHAALGAWLERLASLPVRVAGVRRSLESVPDGYALRRDLLAGVGSLADHGFGFDLVLFGRRLPEVTELARRLPEVSFVLDHLGKPALDRDAQAGWERDIGVMAALPNVTAKLSGLLTTSGDLSEAEGVARRMLAVAIDRFGPRRLMIGTDWPVCELVEGGVHRWLSLLADAMSTLGPGERQAIMSDTARRVYRLD